MYKVLLVDDEEIFLEYMCQAINWEEFNCCIGACCEDGESALMYIEKHQPDIVFMDISIPRMNGLEVCEYIRKKEIPTNFIIMSAHDEFVFAHKAIKLEVTDYLLKPFTEAELEVSVTKILDKLGKQQSVLMNDADAGMQNQALKKCKKDNLIELIEKYIIEHYCEPDLTIECIARDLKFENSYLRRVYKQSAGITIAQKIDKVRIQQAKKLLKESRLLNWEIAMAVGFSDQYYFSRRFKQICGETPTEYRNRRS